MMQQDAGQETIHKHALQGSGFRPEGARSAWRLGSGIMGTRGCGS